MNPSRPDRILEDWDAVASTAHRPAAAPRPVVVRTGLPGATLAGASLIVVGVLVVGFLFSRQAPSGDVGSSPSAPPLATGSPASTASAGLTIAACDHANLSARITSWEGAAGHRIANAELVNAGSDPCLLETMARPQLVDGRGAVLIDGASPLPPATLTFAPGEVVKTLVQAGNYCGPAPVAPVTVAFVLSDGSRVVAAPVSPSDATLPPCNSSPGSAGTIEMHAWAR